MLLEASVTGSISESGGERLQEAVSSHADDLPVEEYSPPFEFALSACLASGEFIASNQREHLERVIQQEWEFAEWLYDERHDSPSLQFTVNNQEQKEQLDARLDAQDSSGEVVVRDDYETRVSNDETTRELFRGIVELVDNLGQLSQPSMSELRQLMRS
jgi:hypothetical protein